MRHRQLEHFQAVVEEGSFTRAAEKLRVAQPSLSSSIAALEKEIGGPLLERLPRGLRLTPAGRAFLLEARAALAATERAKRSARAVLHGEAGQLEVGTVLSLAVGVLPPAIKLWHQHHREASLILTEHHDGVLLEEALLGGTGDLAVGPRPVHPFAEHVLLGVEEFVLVLPDDDPLLATPGRLDVAQLANRPWVLFAPEHGLSRTVDAICSDAGFRPRGAVHTRQTDAAVRLAVAGMGPAIVPGNVIPPGMRRCMRPMTKPFLREIYAYSRTRLDPLTGSFVAALRRGASGLRAPVQPTPARPPFGGRRP